MSVDQQEPLHVGLFAELTHEELQNVEGGYADYDDLVCYPDPPTGSGGARGVGADGPGDGFVNTSDYLVWRDNY